MRYAGIARMPIWLLPLRGCGALMAAIKTGSRHHFFPSRLRPWALFILSLKAGVLKALGIKAKATRNFAFPLTAVTWMPKPKQTGGLAVSMAGISRAASPAPPDSRLRN